MLVKEWMRNDVIESKKCTNMCFSMLSYSMYMNYIFTYIWKVSKRNQIWKQWELLILLIHKESEMVLLIK